MRNIEDVKDGEYCDFIFIIDKNRVLYTIRGSCDEDLLGYNIGENIFLNFDSDIIEIDANSEVNIKIEDSSNFIITPFHYLEINKNDYTSFKF